jgi:hypothetical protein
MNKRKIGLTCDGMTVEQLKVIDEMEKTLVKSASNHTVKLAPFHQMLEAALFQLTDKLKECVAHAQCVAIAMSTYSESLDNQIAIVTETVFPLSADATQAERDAVKANRDATADYLHASVNAVSTAEYSKLAIKECKKLIDTTECKYLEFITDDSSVLFGNKHPCYCPVCKH